MRRPITISAALCTGKAISTNAWFITTWRCKSTSITGKSHWNRALQWLLQGDFERGWPEYEWRLTTPKYTPRGLAQPLWDGSALATKTICIYAEQGLGDTLQFVRFAGLLKQRGARVVLECPTVLHRLLAGAAGIDQLLAYGDPLPPIDLQAPLLSLPGIFRTNLESIPDKLPYLQAEAELVDHWRQKLQGTAGYRIGIVWQGNPENVHDWSRSIPLSCFGKIAAIDGVQLISLQHGPGMDQLRALAASFRCSISLRTWATAANRWPISRPSCPIWTW